MGARISSQLSKEITEASSATIVETSKKALHLCLKRLKNASDGNEIRSLTEELQTIVFAQSQSPFRQPKAVGRC